MTEGCIGCTFKHLGSARVNLEEALASGSDAIRYRERLAKVMDEMAEAEKHIAEKLPQIAGEIRPVRKNIEKVVLGETATTTVKPSDIEAVRWRMLDIAKNTPISMQSEAVSNPMSMHGETGMTTRGETASNPETLYILLGLGLLGLGGIVLLWYMRKKELEK